MKKSKILILLGDLNRCNGITSYVMNYYKHINKEKFHIDFIITNNIIDEEYKDIIEENNSKIFYIRAPKLKTVFKDMMAIKKFLKINLMNYDLFYCHLLNQGYFYLKYAKKLGFIKTIFHSHNIVVREKNKLRDFRNQLFKKLVARNAKYYFACSELAAIDLLGKDKEYIIVNNAIETDKFVYNENIRKKIRKELNLEKNIVFIQVGRLDYQKNPQFSINLIEKLKCSIDNIVLLFVGTGEYDNELKEIVQKKKLDKYIKFLGIRSDVNQLLMAADVFIFPSRFEGLGIVAIEAQVSGLPCYISNNVPRETKMIESTRYLENENINEWEKEILATYKNSLRGDYSKVIQEKKYDILKEVQNLENIFLNIISE